MRPKRRHRSLKAAHSIPSDLETKGATRMSEATAESKPTIVLVHGLWMTPRSWEKWIDRYTERGYRVLAPAYPGLEGEVEALNADPSPIEALTVPTVVESYEQIIRELDQPPI